MNTLFPVFLKLEQLRLLVVGGGAVGLEKTKAVLENSPLAEVTVVAPEIKEELVTLQSAHPRLKLIYASYALEHLTEKDLVIAATCISELNKQVWADAKLNKILVNVADTPDLCDFYLSSVVKKGNLKIAVSTNGKSPTMAKRIREVLENALPEEIDEVLENLHDIREKLRGDFDYKVKKMNDITSSMKLNPDDSKEE
ncbi:MAG TPA: bifunctional precorrin-2 dehydrogenase/sirohydrochlorin ferrochelatase [Cytophagaceae bacterium]|jgi:precorrin-2 dehydrogenase/sirohydrochlorin ferrochelatase|nr:bifunctional precorrin-2 dehydrogenase/sirohydrochlorin ferrochelatase [Cytophagaceae bacterium]